MFIKKHLPILEKLYKQNEKIAQNIPLEETDIDSYFFPVILDIARTDYRTIRISKGFEFCTISIIKFVFDDFIYTQAFKLASELPLSKSELFFVLHCVPDILKRVQIQVPKLHSYSRTHAHLFKISKCIVPTLLQRLYEHSRYSHSGGS